MERSWMLRWLDESQWYRNWREERRLTCTVKIKKPRIKIRGRIIQDPQLNRYRIISFLGVPYALPPVKELRFQPPQPLPNEAFHLFPPVLTAYWHPQQCIQYDEISRSYTGNEDCLYLNIYIPNKPKYNRGRLLPVLFYIHGGGFTTGDAKDVTLDRVVGKERCVCVTVQYRLGALGFLNMRSENCRGNAGLKDQVMALRWVRDNIKAFGGDPENVTICGESAGGTCVNLHMISPLSEGLFHKAIVQSGGVYCPWGYGGHARNIKQLFKRACDKENELRFVVVESFKAQTAKDFLKLSENAFAEKLQTEPHNMTVNLKPSVECIREDAFLPEPVENLMSTAKPVPTIGGITRQEGYMFYHVGPEDPVSMVKDARLFFKFLKQNLNWTDASVTDQLETLRDIYFPNLYVLSEDEILQKLATLITDIFFRRFYDNFKIGNLLESGKFFVYLFDYFSGEKMYDYKAGIQYQPTASEHGDDMLYLLYSWTVHHSLIHIQSVSMTQYVMVCAEVEHVVKRINELWASFCRKGIPVCLEEDVEWKPHKETKPCYLRISNGLEMCDGRLNQRRWQVFNDICRNAVEVESLVNTPQTPQEGA